MANSSVETVNTTNDKLMLCLAAVLVVAGLAGFYLLGSQAWYMRGVALLVGLAAGIGVALYSSSGKSFIAFGKDSYCEVRKVVWPTCKETSQTTLVVFGFVLAMALYLWVSDKTIEWMVFSLILGWK